MKKKLLGIVIALCLIISTCALAACADNNPPEGGAWYAKASVSGGTATLTFTSETEWKLDVTGGAWYKDEWNPWQEGTYRFAGGIGKSTLYMTTSRESENTHIKDTADKQEASFEPTDGVYAIVFDINGKDTTFNLKPPVDGTKPDGTVPEEPCTEHVDTTPADGKCDKCGADMPSQPTEKVVQVALTTEALGGGTINLYTDNTIDFNLTYGGKIFEGTWAAASQTEITLTVDKSTLIGGATESPVGDTLTVTVDPSGYPVMVYTCNANYNTGEAEIPMTFTGELNLSPAPVQKVVQVALTTEALGGGTINLYTDNTIDFNLTYGGKIFEGTWATASQTEITLTVDKSTLIGGATESPVGDTLTVTVDPSGYPVMTYTCNTNYNTGEAEIPMTFTGTLTLS